MRQQSLPIPLQSRNESSGGRQGYDPTCRRDLCAEASRSGRVKAQIVTAQTAPPRGTHANLATTGFNMVLVIQGWALFRLDDRDTLARAGAWLHQAPGEVRSLRDYSVDMEYLEVVGPP